jgi:hypothetical protein
MTNEYDDLPDDDQFGDEIPDKLAIKVHECEVETDYQEFGTGVADITALSGHSPIIEIGKELAAEQTMGYEVAQIRVLEGDKYVNFWVNIGTNRQGRVICEVSTNVKDRTVRKSVQAGAWRDQ